MQSTSATWQEIEAGEHWKEVKAVIGGVDYDMTALASMKVIGEIFGGGTPTLGLAVSRSIQISMLETDSSSIPRMAEIRPYVRICNNTQQSEWLPKGVFYIDTRTVGQNDSLDIEGFDKMLMAECYLDMSSLVWPVIDEDLVDLIVADLNITKSSRVSTLMDQAFQITVPADFTEREILANIAALYGGSFFINDNGELDLVCLWDKPPETNYLVDDQGYRLVYGSDRIILA